MSTTVVMATDKGTVSWQEITKGIGTDDGNAGTVVAGGWLLGPVSVTDNIRYILNSTSGIEDIDIKGLTYRFTDDRDDRCDVVAAMYAVGGDDVLLSFQGWEILYQALPDLFEIRLYSE